MKKALLFGAALLALAACTRSKYVPKPGSTPILEMTSVPQDDPSPSPTLTKGTAMTMTIRSPKFQAAGDIPSEYTCEGKNVSPPLAFDGVPAGAKSLALIVDDPDAPDPKAPKMTWVHWVLYDMPPATASLDEAATPPKGSQSGVTDFKKTVYGGPCPPIGKHRYFFKLYALDTTIGKPGLTKAALEKAMEGHTLAKAELVGTYQKKK
jgi:Raf kinase inhibitor-like YbhB/YbcL family protein